MAPKKEEKKSDVKVKAPSAIKTHNQEIKRRDINRTFKSRVRTAMNHFEAALKNSAAPEAAATALNEVFSMMDKGVKRGIFKRNKADRTKSRFHARLTHTNATKA
jgi:small subunit ribosomal protein S20